MANLAFAEGGRRSAFSRLSDWWLGPYTPHEALAYNATP